MDLTHFSNTITSTKHQWRFLIISLILHIVTPTVSSSPVVASSSYAYQPVDKISLVCSKWYTFTQLPNIFGHATPEKALEEMNMILSSIPSPSDYVQAFICVVYLPPSTVVPSTSRVFSNSIPLPCQSMCDNAVATISKQNGNRKRWPILCHNLPTQKCYTYQRDTGITYLKTSTVGRTSRPEDIMRFAPIEAEMGDNEVYDVEVVSLPTNQTRGRRYDITELGDPDYFHGWTDVQGKGAANDYCRVVGKSKRRFLSCHLSENDSQGHYYVSKLGFEVGHPGTWFMRDMDADGRDDYCRCVGPTSNSKITCMKAGERGFYGSPMQTGSQHTFVLTSSSGCHDRKVNAMFGE